MAKGLKTSKRDFSYLSNLLNWGIEDYTNSGTFNKAFEDAKKKGEENFAWNGKVFNTKSNTTPSQQLSKYGITDKQKEGKNNVTTRAYRTVNPYYSKSPIEGYKAFLNGKDRNENELFKDNYTKAPVEDAWALYTGNPQKHNSFSISKYKPTKAKDKNIEYFSLNEKEHHNTILRLAEGLKENESKTVEAGGLGNTSLDLLFRKFTVSKGKDEKGEYVSYYDKYNLNPSLEFPMPEQGKPVEIYDRIYLNKEKMGYGGRIKKRYAYGDYMDKPYGSSATAIPGQYGTFNQDVNNALGSQKLLPNNNDVIAQKQAVNTTVPSTTAPKQDFFSSSTGNTIGGAANTAAMALNASSSNNKYQSKEEADVDALGTSVASAIGPWWGALAGVGTYASKELKGDSTNTFETTLGEAADPFSQFKGDNAGDIALNFLVGKNFWDSASGKTSDDAKEAIAVKKRAADAERIRGYQGALANYNTSGYGKYGMKFPNDGQLPYTTDGSEVNQLASNVAQYEGDTHENGGIQLDNGAEIEDEEVVKDDMVLSDRLNPSESIKYMMKGLSTQLKSGDTYASVAERLGTKKGEFESKVNSTRLGEAGTAKLMIERYDKAIDVLFQDQQMNKIQNKVGTYAAGGKFDPPEKDTQGKASNKNLKWDDKPFNTYFQPKSEFYNQRKKDPSTGNTYVFDRADYERLGSYDNSLPSDHPLNRPEGAKARAEFEKNPYAQQVVAGELNWNSFGKPGGMQYDILSIGTNGQIPLEQQPKSVPEYTLEQQTLDRLKSKTGDYGSQRFGNTVAGQFFARGGKFANGDKFFDGLDENSGNIMNSIGFLANQAQINKLEIGYTPELVKNPAFTYRDRTNFLRNEYGKQFTTASKGLNQSGAQDNLALKANMYASTLNGLNGALDNEAQRKDNLDMNYNQLATRTGAMNAQILNANREYSVGARNSQRALTQNNTDALIRGYMGNKSQKELQTLDWDKAYIQALASGETGVAQRLMENMPPEIRKRRFGNYDYTVPKKNRNTLNKYDSIYNTSLPDPSLS
jgi:hypothetical protein